MKVLDFGLAKAIDRARQAGGAGRAGGPAGVYRPDRPDRPDPPDLPGLSASPTLTSPAMLTGMGVILGTAASMSPEQAKGRPADKRGDIWAFGCVLYEMLTGSRAFPGDDITDTLANVLKTEPDLAALPSTVPSAVTSVIRRCLQKDRTRRLVTSATHGGVWTV